MIGWSKLVAEDERELQIAYSFEEDRSCDGILSYDKQTRQITVQRPPRHKEWMRELFICPLRYRIRLGMIPDKLYMIMTG